MKLQDVYNDIESNDCQNEVVAGTESLSLLDEKLDLFPLEWDEPLFEFTDSDVESSSDVSSVDSSDTEDETSPPSATAVPEPPACQQQIRQRTQGHKGQAAVSQQSPTARPAAQGAHTRGQASTSATQQNAGTNATRQQPLGAAPEGPAETAVIKKQQQQQQQQPAPGLVKQLDGSGLPGAAGSHTDEGATVAKQQGADNELATAASQKQPPGRQLRSSSRFAAAAALAEQELEEALQQPLEHEEDFSQFDKDYLDFLQALRNPTTSGLTTGNIADESMTDTPLSTAISDPFARMDEDEDDDDFSLDLDELAELLGPMEGAADGPLQSPGAPLLGSVEQRSSGQPSRAMPRRVLPSRQGRASAWVAAAMPAPSSAAAAWPSHSTRTTGRKSQVLSPQKLPEVLPFSFQPYQLQRLHLLLHQHLQLLLQVYVLAMSTPDRPDNVRVAQSVRQLMTSFMQYATVQSQVRSSNGLSPWPASVLGTVQAAVSTTAATGHPAPGALSRAVQGPTPGGPALLQPAKHQRALSPQPPQPPGGSAALPAAQAQGGRSRAPEAPQAPRVNMDLSQVASSLRAYAVQSIAVAQQQPTGDRPQQPGQQASLHVPVQLLNRSTTDKMTAPVVLTVGRQKIVVPPHLLPMLLKKQAVPANGAPAAAPSAAATTLAPGITLVSTSSAASDAAAAAPRVVAKQAPQGTTPQSVTVPANGAAAAITKAVAQGSAQAMVPGSSADAAVATVVGEAVVGSLVTANNPPAAMPAALAVSGAVSPQSPDTSSKVIVQMPTAAPTAASATLVRPHVGSSHACPPQGSVIVLAAGQAAGPLLAVPSRVGPAGPQAEPSGVSGAEGPVAASSPETGGTKSGSGSWRPLAAGPMLGSVAQLSLIAPLQSLLVLIDYVCAAAMMEVTRENVRQESDQGGPSGTASVPVPTSTDDSCFHAQVQQLMQIAKATLAGTLGSQPSSVAGHLLGMPAGTLDANTGAGAQSPSAPCTMTSTASSTHVVAANVDAAAGMHGVRIASAGQHASTVVAAAHLRNVQRSAASPPRAVGSWGNSSRPAHPAAAANASANGATDSVLHGLAPVVAKVEQFGVDISDHWLASAALQLYLSNFKPLMRTGPLSIMTAQQSRNQALLELLVHLIAPLQRFLDPVCLPRAYRCVVMWLEGEDELLAWGVSRHGADYARMSTLLPCHTEDQIRNRVKNLCAARMPDNPVKAAKERTVGPLTRRELELIRWALSKWGMGRDTWSLIKDYLIPSRLVKIAFAHDSAGIRRLGAMSMQWHPVRCCKYWHAYMISRLWAEAVRNGQAKPPPTGHELPTPAGVYITTKHLPPSQGATARQHAMVNKHTDEAQATTEDAADNTIQGTIALQQPTTAQVQAALGAWVPVVTSAPAGLPLAGQHSTAAVAVQMAVAGDAASGGVQGPGKGLRLQVPGLLTVHDAAAEVVSGNRGSSQHFCAINASLTDRHNSNASTAPAGLSASHPASFAQPQASADAPAASVVRQKARQQVAIASSTAVPLGPAPLAPAATRVCVANRAEGQQNIPSQANTPIHQPGPQKVTANRGALPGTSAPSTVLPMAEELPVMEGTRVVRDASNAPLQLVHAGDSSNRPLPAHGTAASRPQDDGGSHKRKADVGSVEQGGAVPQKRARKPTAVQPAAEKDDEEGTAARFDPESPAAAPAPAQGRERRYSLRDPRSRRPSARFRQAQGIVAEEQPYYFRTLGRATGSAQPPSQQSKQGSLPGRSSEEGTQSERSLEGAEGSGPGSEGQQAVGNKRPREGSVEIAWDEAVETLAALAQLAHSPPAKVLKHKQSVGPAAPELVVERAESSSGSRRNGKMQRVCNGTDGRTNGGSNAPGRCDARPSSALELSDADVAGEQVSRATDKRSASVAEEASRQHDRASSQPRQFELEGHRPGQCLGDDPWTDAEQRFLMTHLASVEALSPALLKTIWHTYKSVFGFRRRSYEDIVLQAGWLHHKWLGHKSKCIRS